MFVRELPATIIQCASDADSRVFKRRGRHEPAFLSDSALTKAPTSGSPDARASAQGACLP
jgi:hypothetical protein